MNNNKIAEISSSFIRLYQRLITDNMRIQFKEYPMIHKGFGSTANLLAGRHCIYFTYSEIDRLKRLQSKIIFKIRKGTRFQIWLQKQPEYTGIKSTLQKKVWLGKSTGRLKKEYNISNEEEIEWAFFHIVASTLLVYFKPYDYSYKLLMLGELEKPKPSEKIIKLSKKLLFELKHSEMTPSISLDRVLKRLANGETPTMLGERDSNGLLSPNQRRRLMIREIALLSHRILRLKRSETGRFPPDLVQLILKLAKVDCDLRTIQFIQKPFDGSTIQAIDDGDTSRLYRPLTENQKNNRKDQLDRIRGAHDNALELEELGVYKKM